MENILFYQLCIFVFLSVVKASLCCVALK